MASVARQPVPRPQDRYWTSINPHPRTDIRYTPREAVPGRQLVALLRWYEVTCAILVLTHLGSIFLGRGSAMGSISMLGMDV